MPAWPTNIDARTTHSGTHVDAPYHYAPTSAGAPARTIDQVPLRRLMGDGVVLNLAHCDRDAGIARADVQAELCLDRARQRRVGAGRGARRGLRAGLTHGCYGRRSERRPTACR
jgi:kynurenine formamidase